MSDHENLHGAVSCTFGLENFALPSAQVLVGADRHEEWTQVRWTRQTHFRGDGFPVGAGE